MKIYLVGYMASGKSTVGKKLARSLNCEFIDLDRMIEEKVRLSVSDIFKTYDEETFRLLEQNMFNQVLNDKRNLVISTGGGTPCFNNNMDLMNQDGITVYLKMSVAALYSRLKNSKAKRPLVNLSSPETLQSSIEKRLETREPIYKKAKIVVEALSIDILALSEKVESSLNNKV